MIRPPDSLKSSANRLADLLGSQQGHRILRLLAEFESADASTHPNNQPALAFSSPVSGRVGIWERESRDKEVCFMRERDSTYWGLWAQVEMIRLRPEARKVVLLGESVARGFFYDPNFNPAMALEQILRSASGDEDIDVIDLARIGIGLKELLELACSSIELEPDVLVILAGNNWRPVVGLSVEDRQDMIDIWRRTGAWSEVRTLVEDKLRCQVNDFITSLASIAGTRKVVIIIPEFNLLDWREEGGPALLLDSDENDQWILAREEARIAFSKRDFVRCSELARQMLEIDGGTSSTAYRLLSDIAIEKGELQEARELLQTARDVGIFLPRVETPRCYSVIQESLRQAAKAYGIAVIDLPEVFEEYLGGGLPGRDLFHDYCHFTADGIRLSMSATAEALRQIDPNFRHQLTYCSPKMHALINNIECAARRDIPVLITGETGVGKELIARFIHVSSTRKRGPLIPINCAAITRDLFEDQFFGHRQGAFTGALRDYPGVIRSASGGTLFLDEVGEIPLDLQPKLLRFLQEGEVHTVGENLPVRVDVRVVASTNRDLKAEVKQGRFRADLLHRLNVISFEIPPLRERPEDIPLLLNFFIKKYSCLPGNHKVQFAPDAIDCLTKYSWPGNVRELSNLVLRITSLAEEEIMIFLSDLPVEITSRTDIVIPEDQSTDRSTVPVEYVAKS